MELFYLLCLGAALGIILIYLLGENIIHRHNLKQIPIRIHVNGTRGKSSVARLIAAGLRAGGITTVAKTTGTLARMIDDKGHELPVFRVGFTNIIEQVKVVRWAKKRQAKALVIECMALHPLLQSLCELKIVRATHGVLTNARPDHLDVMGPKEENVAEALASTVPVKGLYFTAEDKHLGILRYAVKDRKSEMHTISQHEIDSITDDEINQFIYSEFKVNVALALKVVMSLGIDRSTALQGMYDADPDPGAMTEYTFMYEQKKVYFANAFAANDPVSTKMLWDNLCSKYQHCCQKVLIVNCRADREDRSAQMARAIIEWDSPSKIILIGTGTGIFEHYYEKDCTKKNITPRPLITCEGATPTEIIHQATYTNNHDQEFILVGVGNIAGIGLKLIDFCQDGHHQYKENA